MQLAQYHTRGRDLDQPCVKAVRKAMSQKAASVYIVGKGPSLDALTAEDFAEHPGAPILCINESIHAIERLSLPSERLFCVQYDRLKGISNKPARGTWLLSSYAWSQQKGEEAGAIRFELKALAPAKPNLTATTALSIAALAGARRALMLGFDAAFGGNCDYAPSIGHGPELPRQNQRRFVRFAEHAIPARAAEEGMSLIWQAPRDFWTVALVLKSGGQYDARHVKAIARQINTRLKTPHRLMLLSDQLVDGVRRIPLATDWPGWFAKLELFRPDIGLRGGVLFTDLDNYFGRDFELPRWDVMEPGKLFMPRDPYRDLHISALMAWRIGTVTAPYERFALRPVAKHPGNRVYGDQEVINATCDILPLDFITTASWKADQPKPDGVDCILFHGKPKPWDAGLVDPGTINKGAPPDKQAHDPRERVKEFLRQHPQFTPIEVAS